MNAVTGTMAHAFSRWSWSEASFDIGGEAWSADIDALAIRRGGGAFERLDRMAVAFPPTAYNRIGTSFTSTCGTLVRIEIEKATGIVRIAKAYSVLECGEALVPEVVRGQSQGGFAMGLGQALMETLPPFEDGPGNGQWRSRPLSHRPRVRPAAPRSRGRDPAAAVAEGTAEGHGRGRDDPGGAGAAQRHQRRHRPSLHLAAGDGRPHHGVLA